MSRQSQTTPSTRQAARLAELLLATGVIDAGEQSRVRDFYSGGYPVDEELELATGDGRQVILRGEPPWLYLRASAANGFRQADVEHLAAVNQQLTDLWADLDDERIELGRRSRRSPLAG